MPNGPVEYVDLSDGPPRYELLNEFVKLYDETFTDPTEREDPAEWPERLWGPDPINPRTHLIVAAASDGDSPNVIGGIMFEYYRESGCGLLTYLVVAPAHRKRGVAAELVNRARVVLDFDAGLADRTLEAIFAETEDPLSVKSASGMNVNDRLSALHSLGARWIDVPYVQPELQEGCGRSRHLLLLDMSSSRSASHSSTVFGNVVRAFLDELYRTLGVADPGNDRDFVSMTDRLVGDIELKDLRGRISNV